jgi:hypothetical protein
VATVAAGYNTPDGDSNTGHANHTTQKAVGAYFATEDIKGDRIHGVAAAVMRQAADDFPGIDPSPNTDLIFSDGLHDFTIDAGSTVSDSSIQISYQEEDDEDWPDIGSNTTPAKIEPPLPETSPFNEVGFSPLPNPGSVPVSANAMAYLSFHTKIYDWGVEPIGTRPGDDNSIRVYTDITEILADQ